MIITSKIFIKYEKEEFCFQYDSIKDEFNIFKKHWRINEADLYEEPSYALDHYHYFKSLIRRRV